jgi:guanosine-3',5'-bis(diphosphate) 3'-pyrophosphohydrolase
MSDIKKEPELSPGGAPQAADGELTAPAAENPAEGAEFYSAKTHLQGQVREIGTISATAQPADAAVQPEFSDTRPELITYDKLLGAIAASGRNYNMELIDRAYHAAERLHEGVRRRSGEPYISHPLAVARLLIDLGMDSESIAAALLHDVVEDTPYTIEEVRT